MRAMARRLTATAVLALALAGCSDDEPAVPVACLQDAASVQLALAAAPRAVTLADGTRLATCVARVRDDGDLQTLGVTMTAVADELEARAAREPAAAVRLGYLVGAVRKGARDTNGIALELARRMEGTAALDGAPPAARAALRRGLRAGEATG
jgi:hypothetical protein